MSTQIFYFVSFLGAIQGSLISLVLWLKRVNTANKFFTFFLLLYSVGLLEPYLDTIFQPGNPILQFLTFSNFLYGPLIYLYILHLYRTLTQKQILIHFLPFIIGFAGNSLLDTFEMGIDKNPVLELVLFETLIVQLIGYTLAALKLLRSNRDLILKEQKSFNATDIRWLQRFLILLLIIYCLSFTVTNLSLIGYSQLNVLHRFNQVIMMLSIYAVAYKLLLKPEFLLFRNSQPQSTNGQLTKYSRSGLTEEKANGYLMLLQNCMCQHQPYLDPELSVHDLANKIGISKNHLTQVLNESLGKNFYEFVNDYRVQQAKDLIADPDLHHLNLSALGLRSGFKSKTGFNTNFKKSTGLTPSEWKKKHSR